ncbi:phage head-tail adapter protein [Macrococcoides goetzii]|uniref:Phage head-tail adapter protein n=1 Tax=Macrococcoides goetzii TaxID=1891097 RepID=A0A2G5NWV8_9STAP|nr:phage head-tail adapter protein [Macrococcus goetzii]RAI79672.1 phage head-tail adapter protein [Macrococcus goetzii]
MNPLEVRTINQWPDSKVVDDTKLQMLIEVYRGIAQDECNDQFIDGYEPMGVKKFIAYSINLHGEELFTSKSMGSVSYSYSDIPKSITNYLSPYMKMRW